MLSRPEWSGQLHWQDRNSFKRSGHRPDLVAAVGSGIAIEVELAGKSRPRLDSILRLHASWITSGNSGGVIYVCGDEEGQRRVKRSAERVGPFGRKLRLELLDTTKAEAYAGYEAAKFERVSKPSAASRPMLAVDGADRDSLVT